MGLGIIAGHGGSPFGGKLVELGATGEGGETCGRPLLINSQEKIVGSIGEAGLGSSQEDEGEDA
jgi:hypothetical protein